jgi:hypothetical protein
MRTIYFGRNALGRVQRAPGEPLSLQSKTSGLKPRNTVPPSITGATTTTGSVMNGDPGQWVGAGPLVFTWKLNGQVIQDGGVSYTVQAADAGKTLTLTVGCMNAYGGASSTSAGRVLG